MWISGSVQHYLWLECFECIYTFLCNLTAKYNDLDCSILDVKNVSSFRFGDVCNDRFGPNIIWWWLYFLHWCYVIPLMRVILSNVWSRNQINLICIKYYNPKLVADVAPWASLYFSWLGMSAFIHDSFRRDSTSAMTRQHSIGIQLRINMLLTTFNFERKKNTFTRANFQLL